MNELIMRSMEVPNQRADRINLRQRFPVRLELQRSAATLPQTFSVRENFILNQQKETKS